MAFGADQAVLLDRLDDELQFARAPMRDLFPKLVAGACVRLPMLDKSGPAARIERLIGAGAWTEAAIALIEFELPVWKLRRLVYEDGEWLCTLSRQPNLPVAIDDAAEASHAVLPLAILRAFVEARRGTSAAAQSASGLPQVEPLPDATISCENFV